jgi:hypothetical protein
MIPKKKSEHRKLSRDSLRPPPSVGSMIYVRTQSRLQHHQSDLVRHCARPGGRHDWESQGSLLVVALGPPWSVHPRSVAVGDHWQRPNLISSLKRANTTHAISRTRSSMRSNTRLGAGIKNCALPSDQMIWSCVGERNINNLRNPVDCGLVRENLRLLLGPISKEDGLGGDSSCEVRTKAPVDQDRELRRQQHIRCASNCRVSDSAGPFPGAVACLCRCLQRTDGRSWKIFSSESVVGNP